MGHKGISEQLLFPPGVHQPMLKTFICGWLTQGQRRETREQQKAGPLGSQTEVPPTIVLAFKFPALQVRTDITAEEHPTLDPNHHPDFRESLTGVQAQVLRCKEDLGGGGKLSFYTSSNTNRFLPQLVGFGNFPGPEMTHGLSGLLCRAPHFNVRKPVKTSFICSPIWSEVVRLVISCLLSELKVQLGPM